MRRCIVKAVVAISISLLVCYIAAGWEAVIGGVIVCIIAGVSITIDYRRHHATH